MKPNPQLPLYERGALPIELWPQKSVLFFDQPKSYFNSRTNRPKYPPHEIDSWSL